MEPMVVCAMGIVVYFGYLTVMDIIADLQHEGIKMKGETRKTNRKVSTMGYHLFGRCLSCVGGLFGADVGLVSYSNPAGSVSGNVWAGGLPGGYHGHHHNGRPWRG